MHILSPISDSGRSVNGDKARVEIRKYVYLVSCGISNAGSGCCDEGLYGGLGTLDFNSTNNYLGVLRVVVLSSLSFRSREL